MEQDKTIEYIDRKQPQRTIKRSFKKAVNKITAQIFKHFKPQQFKSEPPKPTMSYRRYYGGYFQSQAIKNECKKYASTKGFNNLTKSGNLP